MHSWPTHSLDSLDKKAEYKRQAEIQLKMLLRFEDVRFGWGYYDMDEIKAAQSTGKVNSFTTASCILGLLDAANTMSLELPDKLVQRAKEAILIQRKPDFSYAYEWGHRWVPNNPINKPAGSLARSQACNLALRKLGDKDVTDEVIQTWLARLFKLQGWLDIGRKKPIPHEAPAAISGYFYYYGHYYAAECIHLLPENEQDNWKAKLSELMISRQEANGSWWDYPLYNYHYAYGTGYALATMVWCRPSSKK